MDTPSESYLSQSSSQSLNDVTNTLVIASLPTPYFHPTILRIIQGYFLQFGELYSFAPVPSFKRIIVVFYDDDAAEEAKLCLNGKILGDDGRAVLKVYRGAPTPLPNPEDDSLRYLAPPVPEKNFLISPPGSPPEGWEQIKEDPPNEAPLADDLLAALRRLQEEQELRGGSGFRRTEDGKGEVLWHANETPAGVGVCVEPCEDEDDDDDSMEEIEERPRWSYDMNIFPSHSSTTKTSSSFKTSFLSKSPLSSKVPFPRTALPPRI